MKKKLVLATANKDKIVEIKKLLGDLDIELLCTTDFPDMPEVVEDRDTLEGNAIKKAREISEFTGLPAVSDDTGLEVDYLNGDPGVYSARYAGEQATYADNVNKLLTELSSVGIENRAGKFRCVVAFYENGAAMTVEGQCNGIIAETPRGDKGFGYDSVFILPEHNQTFAEMERDVKNSISHRGLAFRRFHDLLRKRWF